MIRTIILDFGNVVGHFDHTVACKKLAESSPLSPKEIRAALHDGPLEDAFERGAIDTAEFVQKGIETIQYAGTADEFMAAYAEIFAPNAAVVQALPVLARQYRLVLASNTNPLHARQFRRQFRDELSYFTALGLSHEVRARKPEPEFFTRVHELTAARADQCLFFDDIADNVRAAREFGWNAVTYKKSVDLVAVAADYNERDEPPERTDP